MQLYFSLYGQQLCVSAQAFTIHVKVARFQIRRLSRRHLLFPPSKSVGIFFMVPCISFYNLIQRSWRVIHGVEENNTLQILKQLLLGFTGKLRHIWHVDSRFFRKGQSIGLGSRVPLINWELFWQITNRILKEIFQGLPTNQLGTFSRFWQSNLKSPLNFSKGPFYLL